MSDHIAIVWLYILADEQAEIDRIDEVDVFVNGDLTHSATRHDFAQGLPPAIHMNTTDHGPVDITSDGPVRLVFWDRRITDATEARYIVRDPEGQRAALMISEGGQQRRYDAAADDAQEIWSLTGIPDPLSSEGQQA